MELIKFIIGMFLMLLMGILMPIYRGLELLEDYFKKQQWPGSIVFRYFVWIVSIPFAIVVKIFESMDFGGH